MWTYLKARWGEVTSIWSAAGVGSIAAAYLLGKIDRNTAIISSTGAVIAYLLPEKKGVVATAEQVVLGALKKAVPLMVAGAVLASLSACAEWNAGVSSVNSYVGQQITAQQQNIQGANDNAAKAWAETGCAIPYGELVRNGSGNPNLAAAVIELCGAPSGFTTIHTQASATATTTIPTVTVPAPAPAPPAAAGTAPATSSP